MAHTLVGIPKRNEKRVYVARIICHTSIKREDDLHNRKVSTLVNTAAEHSHQSIQDIFGPFEFRFGFLKVPDHAHSDGNIGHGTERIQNGAESLALTVIPFAQEGDTL